MLIVQPNPEKGFNCNDHEELSYRFWWFDDEKDFYDTWNTERFNIILGE